MPKGALFTHKETWRKYSLFSNHPPHKSNMKSFPRISILAASTLLGSLFMVGCGQSSDDAASSSPSRSASAARTGDAFPLAAAYVPDASLAVSIDMASVLASSFYQKVDAAGQEQGASFEAFVAEMDPEARAAFEQLDLKPENVTGILFSMGGLDFTYGDPMSNPESLRFAAVVNLDKTLTADQIRAIIAEHVDEEYRDDITEYSHAGVTFFTGPAEPGEPQITFGIHEGRSGSSIIFGDDASARGTADRAAGQVQVPAHLATLSSELAGQSNSYLIFSMPAELRAMLEEQINAPGNPMGAMMAPLLGLEGISLSLNSAENLDVVLSGLFAEADQAGMVAMMINAQLMPMARMMLTDESGEVPGFVQKLTSVAEGKIFKLSTSLTPEEAISMGEDLPMAIMGGF